MKRTTKTALIALITASAVGATALTASAFGGGDRGMRGHGDRMGGPGGVMQMEFADLDMDKNGQITAADLAAHGQARFDAADTDGNGQLSVEEMTAQAKLRMETRMQAGNGQGLGAGQGNAQANGQGMGQRNAQGPRDGQVAGRGPMADKRMGWAMETMIERRDVDKNGTLSFEEMSPDMTKLDRMIDRFDTDDDNAISAEEFDTAQKEMFQRHARKGGRGH